MIDPNESYFQPIQLVTRPVPWKDPTVSIQLLTEVMEKLAATTTTMNENKKINGS